MKTKLTKREKTAQAFCQSIRASLARGDAYSFTVEWNRSTTWGSNPQIEYRGDKCLSVSGCGYCKPSTALADALRFLPDDETAQARVHSAGGCGVSTVKTRLREAGFTLEETASGKTFDVFTLRRA